MTVFLTFVILLCKLACNFATFSSQTFRKDFEKSFANQCLKYGFVDKFLSLQSKGDMKLLANNSTTSMRYLHFDFQHHGNGGLGDRIAGLVTAATIALRHDRAFVLQPDDTFGDLFRPLHSSDMISLRSSKNSSTVPITTKKAAETKDWTQLWKAYKSMPISQKHDIHNMHCHDATSEACGMDEDLQNKTILYLGNRVHLCRWERTLEGQAAAVFQSLGFTKDRSLFEAAGCLLRTVMWPTERLWKYVDKMLTELKIASVPSAPSKDTKVVANKNNQVRGLVVKVSMQTSTMKRMMTTATTAPTSNLQERRGKLVAVHFRCGDASFHENSNHTIAMALEQHCIDYATRLNFVSCAQASRGKIRAVTKANLNSSTLVTNSGAAVQNKDDEDDGDVLIVFSDNPASAEYIRNSSTVYPTRVITPRACHVDKSKSRVCQEMTYGYWFLLTLNDYLLTNGKAGDPFSGFSRFAMIYGLHEGTFIESIHCHARAFDRSVSGPGSVWPYDASRNRTTGNWICEVAAPKVDPNTNTSSVVRPEVVEGILAVSPSPVLHPSPVSTPNNRSKPYTAPEFVN